MEVATAVTAEQVIRYAIDETLLERRGAGGVYACAGDDAWVAIDRSQDSMAPEARAAWCATRTPDEAARDALAQGVAAAAMVPAFATLDDPQMRARGFFEPVDNPLVGEQEYPTWPVRLSGGPERVWTAPAPTPKQSPLQLSNNKLMAAISDATPDDDRSFLFPWKPEEQKRLTGLMEGLAQEELASGTEGDTTRGQGKRPAKKAVTSVPQTTAKSQKIAGSP